jgi:hypothetical protein
MVWGIMSRRKRIGLKGVGVPVGYMRCSTFVLTVPL